VGIDQNVDAAPAILLRRRLVAGEVFMIAQTA